MKKLTYIIIILLVGLVGTSLYKTIIPVDNKTLKIGVISIGSGQYAAPGESFVRGIELALDEYKQEHPKEQIELIVEDDAFDGAKGLSAYKKLTTLDHVDALINLSTPTIGSIYDLVRADGLPLLQGGVQVATATDDNVFQISPDGNKALTSYGKYISAEYNFKNIAVVRDNTDYHLGFFNGFKNGLPENYNVTEYVNDSKDVRTLAAQIVSKKHDAIIFLMNTNAGALLTKELLIHSVPPSQFFYDVQLNTGLNEYKKILGDINKINDAKALMLHKEDLTVFNKKYKEKFNTEPGFFSDYGYDAFTALIHAKSPSKDTWIKNIEASHVKGAASDIVFDENGVRKSSAGVNVVKNGDITVLKEEI